MSLAEFPKPLVDWLEEVEVFSLRLERLYSDVEMHGAEGVLKWLRAAYELGLERGRKAPEDVE